MERNERTVRLIGKEAQEKLKESHVAVFGVGGVGGAAVEALARAGVGIITLVDKDTVSESNINRQLIALSSTVGKEKTLAWKERILEINPTAGVYEKCVFFLPENAEDFDFSEYDYVLDCVDTVTAKLELVTRCHAVGTPIISAMGAGNKLDPSRFEVTDISKTTVCPLARVMRQELKKRGIYHLPVVFSTETPVKSAGEDKAPGSISFVPPVMGYLMAGKVIRDLAGLEEKK